MVFLLHCFSGEPRITTSNRFKPTTIVDFVFLFRTSPRLT
jgi:hypothetical protein